MSGRRDNDPVEGLVLLASLLAAAWLCLLVRLFSRLCYRLAVEIGWAG